MTMKKGDMFRHEVAGAGGWGDPLERDPALVLRDVLNDFVSEPAAREDYGVVLTGAPPAVDALETGSLRRHMRAGRQPAETSIYNHGTRAAAE